MLLNILLKQLKQKSINVILSVQIATIYAPSSKEIITQVLFNSNYNLQIDFPADVV